MVFNKSVHPSALDKSSLSIGRVNYIHTWRAVAGAFSMACQNDIYSTHKISCNFQNIVQLCLNISCNSQNNMQLRKGVYFLGTCIMNSEKLWVL